MYEASFAADDAWVFRSRGQERREPLCVWSKADIIRKLLCNSARVYCSNISTVPSVFWLKEECFPARPSQKPEVHSGALGTRGDLAILHLRQHIQADFIFT